MRRQCVQLHLPPDRSTACSCYNGRFADSAPEWRRLNHAALRTLANQATAATLRETDLTTRSGTSHPRIAKTAGSAARDCHTGPRHTSTPVHSALAVGDAPPV